MRENLARPRRVIYPVFTIKPHPLVYLPSAAGFVLLRWPRVATAPSPYVAQLASPVRGLSPEEVRAMQAEARRLGAGIIERERVLTAQFADRAITERDLALAVDSLARLYGRLRTTHLAAHLATTALLTEAQVARYAKVRGYGGGYRHDG